MATSLRRMARWARQLRWEQVPTRVQERVRLQQLAMAGAVRAVATRPLARRLDGMGAKRGWATRVTGGRTGRRDALRLHASLAGCLCLDDWVLHGSPGRSALTAAWAWAAGHSVEELLVACVAGQEIAARLGASLLLGPEQELGEPLLASLASAVVVGLLEGLDEEGLSRACALAIAGAGRLCALDLVGGGEGLALLAGKAAVDGADAVALAQAGLHGPEQTLDLSGGLLDQRSPVPLRGAFTALGEVWFIETMAFQLLPAARWMQAPLQGLHEILRRHVKAAEKRLRPDQVERIEVELGAPGWWASRRGRQSPPGDASSLVHRLPEAMGLLLSEHALGPDQLLPELVESRWDAIQQVASRVELRHSWRRSIDLADHLVEALAPLLVGLGRAELGRAASVLAGSLDGPVLPTPGGADLVTLVRARPDRWLEKLRASSGDLRDLRLSELQLRWGADIRLTTRRGGAWPEHRDLPEGSPGWPWQDTRRRLLERWGGGPEQVGAAERLLSVAPADDAAGFVESLLRIAVP